MHAQSESQRNSEEFLLPCWMERKCWWPTAFFEAVPYLLILHGIIIMLIFEQPAGMMAGLPLLGAGLLALIIRLRQKCDCRKKRQSQAKI